MKRALITAVAAIVFAGGSALAADLPGKAPVYKAPPSYFNWTGCYVGGYVGGAFTDDATLTDRGGGAFPNYNPPTGHSWGYDLDNSVIGGGTLGCNWQAPGSRFVLGLEGEVGYLRLTGSAPDPNSPALDTVGSTTIGDWYGVAAGRLGFAVDRTLFYAKGGAAFFRVRSSVVDACNTGGCGVGLVSASDSNTEVTWALGGGIEHAFGHNWSIKAEYLFLGDRGDQSACGLATAGPATGTKFCWTHDTSGIHTAKIGLNYRFGGPLVARY